MREEGFTMAGLAKSNGNTGVWRVDSKERFIKQFNAQVPSKEFKDSCKKAGQLFDGAKKKTG